MTRIKYLLILFLAVGAVLTSCRTPSTAPGATLEPGDYEETIDSGGKTRSYILHIPKGYHGETETALVLVLHGGGGRAEHMIAVTGFNEKADEEGFIAVYPNGTGLLSDERLLTWNAGYCCGYAMENDIDDAGFMRALIEKLDGELAIDGARVYATGISNGGMMSYRLGVELSDKIAAIAPVAGAMPVLEAQPKSPVSVIIFNGTADEHVLYEGGAPIKTIDRNPRVDKPVSYAVDYWVEHNGCSDIAVKETEGSIIKETYGGGRDGSEVILYSVVGGKHAWPGGVTAWLGGDTPTHEIDATDLMWEFFKAHPKK